MSGGLLQLLAGPYCERGINRQERKERCWEVVLLWQSWSDLDGIMERNKSIFDGARGEEIDHCGIEFNTWLLSGHQFLLSLEIVLCMLYGWIEKLLCFSFMCPLSLLYCFCISIFHLDIFFGYC